MSIFCVTGGTSFIASHLINLLLQSGHTVHTTIRNLSSSKHQFLLNLPSSSNLKFFEADLLIEGSYKGAFEGCVGVFHCAGPWLATATWDEHWQPLVEGMRNVVGCAIQCETVKRVVVVSSCAAVYCICSKGLNKDRCVFTEEDWNDGEHDEACQQSKRAEKSYFASKTAAEKKAWEMVKEANQKDPKRDLSLVSINPSVVFGRLLSTPSQETLNTSMQLLPGLLFGGDSGGTGVVDVEDVAQALFRAMTYPAASGRYICNGGSYHYSTLSSILAKLYPDRCFAEECPPPDETIIPLFKTDKITKELGINFTNIQETLKKAMDSLIEKNCLPVM